MLEVHDLHTYYGDSHILHGMTLRVDKGTVVAVLGRNGVGKTTLVHSIISFVVPRMGKIMFGGINITGWPTHKMMRAGIGLVPQGRRVFPSLSVRENLLIPYRCSPAKDSRSAPWTIDEVATAFPSLWARRDQKAGSLSGGEQQMLVVARALVSCPRLLLLDEPSEGLAPLIVQHISSIIAELAKLGMAILLVEQNFNMAMNLADNVYVMSRGKVVHESQPQDLIHNEMIKSRYLGV